MAKTRYDRECTVCKRHFEYCHCPQYSHLEPWHDAYCSSDCHELYNIAAGYLNGWKSPQEEAARLKTITIPARENLSDWMNKAIDELQEIGNIDFSPEEKPAEIKEEKQEEEPDIKSVDQEGAKMAQDFKKYQSNNKKHKPSKPQNKD